MDREFLPPSPILDERRFLVTHTSYPRVRAKDKEGWGKCARTHTHMDVTPFPLTHTTPRRVTMMLSVITN